MHAQSSKCKQNTLYEGGLFVLSGLFINTKTGKADTFIIYLPVCNICILPYNNVDGVLKVILYKVKHKII